jgi:peptidoglycan/xylan/chitin deacetylase (PgdA/CDA1 family)
MFAVRPGEYYGYWFKSAGQDARVQARLIWFDVGLSVLSWDDSDVWLASSADSHWDGRPAPERAAYLRLELRSVDDPGSTTILRVREPVLTESRVYVEPHPNGAQASVAFSFDWETAMGGAIHSKGNEVHDPEAAAAHGLAMREGADWLADLFRQHDLGATFYATGYNLLDSNTERLKFNGDPTYQWASPDNGWATDYWLTHPWFSDDPFSTFETHPAWYFGDQTRRLLADGHEIAPHTFAHIYVRGANPAEIATDLDTWIEVGTEAGVPAPSTFAFPWRSSNSLTKEFYDALHERGIRAVTRIYPLDMKDLYVLSNAVVYTDVRQPQVYPAVAIMPDFLLGAPAESAGEEVGGAPVGLDEGLAVLREAISRRGTTSFWTHPEQLADDPALAAERAAWEGVVRAAAEERDKGRLRVDTVEAITAYQRDIQSVTASFVAGSNGPDYLYVENNSGKALDGVTLTLTQEVTSLRSNDARIRPVYRTDCEGQGCRVVIGEPTNGPFETPTHQIVLDGLKTGRTTIEYPWP